ncbi:hypothetical protein [Archangium sp.]|uniref:hypothetical protein n=1 Tax=Archangium sp. TaxID=1872627 RepID=UPI00389B1A97
MPLLGNEPARLNRGFSGTRMGLLLYAPDEVRDLYYTVSKGWKYRDVTESKDNVKARLEKRANKGLIDNALAHPLDVGLSLGLMITFTTS